MHLVYYTEFDKLLQVHLGELDVVGLWINERVDMSEELLGIVSAPANNTLSISRMAWELSGNVFCSWMLPLMSEVIAFIDCGYQYSLIQTFHLSQ